MCTRNISHSIPELQEVYLKAGLKFKERNPNIQIILLCVYRSPEEQNRLYSYPYDKKDNNSNGVIDEKSEKVTNARGGQSPHNYLPSFAYDITFKDSSGKYIWNNISLYKEYRDICRSINSNVDWLGKIGDYGRIQLINWRSKT